MSWTHSDARCLTGYLLLQTYHNVLHIYGVHHSKEPVLATSASPLGASPAVDLRKVAIYLQQSLSLSGGEGSSAATTDLVADSRSVLVAFSDGACQLFSWAAQVQLNGPSCIQVAATYACFVLCHGIQL